MWGGPSTSRFNSLRTNEQTGTTGSLLPGTQDETPTAATPAVKAAISSTTVAAVSDTTQAQIDACKQEWEHITASMQECRLPSIVQGYADNALLNTAHTSRFCVEKGARKHWESMSFCLAKPRGPGLKM